MISMATVHSLVDDLTEHIATWNQRDDSKPQPAGREAANDAASTLGALSREVYRVRGVLVDEILASDRAAAARVDALLAEHHGGAR